MAFSCPLRRGEAKAPPLPLLPFPRVAPRFAKSLSPPSLSSTFSEPLITPPPPPTLPEGPFAGGRDRLLEDVLGVAAGPRGSLAPLVGPSLPPLLPPALAAQSGRLMPF